MKKKINFLFTTISVSMAAGGSPEKTRTLIVHR